MPANKEVPAKTVRQPNPLNDVSHGLRRRDPDDSAFKRIEQMGAQLSSANATGQRQVQEQFVQAVCSGRNCREISQMLKFAIEKFGFQTVYAAIGESIPDNTDLQHAVSWRFRYYTSEMTAVQREGYAAIVQNQCAQAKRSGNADLAQRLMQHAQEGGITINNPTTDTAIPSLVLSPLKQDVSVLSVQRPTEQTIPPVLTEETKPGKQDWENPDSGDGGKPVPVPDPPVDSEDEVTEPTDPKAVKDAGPAENIRIMESGSPQETPFASVALHQSVFVEEKWKEEPKNGKATHGRRMVGSPQRSYPVQETDAKLPRKKRVRQAAEKGVEAAKREKAISGRKRQRHRDIWSSPAPLRYGKKEKKERKTAPLRLVGEKPARPPSAKKHRERMSKNKAKERLRRSPKTEDRKKSRKGIALDLEKPRKMKKDEKRPGRKRELSVKQKSVENKPPSAPKKKPWAGRKEQKKRRERKKQRKRVRELLEWKPKKRKR